MRRSIAIVAVVLCAACGRYGYGDLAALDGDGGPGGDDAAVFSTDGGTSAGNLSSGLTIDPAGTGTVSRPQLVFDGFGYGIAYDVAGDGVYFLRIDDTGAVVAGPVRVSSQDEASSAPWIDWTGKDYVVSWSAGGTARAAYVEPLGVIGAQYSSATGTAEVPVTVGCTDVECAIAWRDLSSVYYAMLTPEGAIPADRVSAGNSVTSFDGAPRFNGTTWSIAFGATSGLQQTRFTSEAILGTEPVVVMGIHSYVHLAWNGGRYGVVWVNNPNLVFIPTSADGVALGPQQPLPAPGQASLTLVRGILPITDGFLVMRGHLQELLSGNWQTYVHRIDGDGNETEGAALLDIPPTTPVSFDPRGPTPAAIWVDVDDPTKLSVRTF